MFEIGYALSSEEHSPSDLVGYAQRAESAGFTFALISDHYHPWTDRQGESPFVWSVIGAIAQSTERLRLGTGVTCPLMRIHPAIVAQAAATAASLMPGRFFLGVGTGENLNEHVLGEHWPSASIRLEMLEEAVQIIRELWEGQNTSHRGKHYTVDRARIYTLPDPMPKLLVAAKGDAALELAGRLGDGLIATDPDEEVINGFESAGGRGKPKIGMAHVCWAETEAQAKKTALEWWPNSSIRGEAGVDLATPKHFEALAQALSEDDVAESCVCSPDPESHIGKIIEFKDAGFDQVYLHQVGPDQEGFFRFYETEILPKLSSVLQPA